MEVYNLHSARIKKLIGIDIQMVTYKKYLESGRHLQAFIKYKLKAKDIQLKALKSSFLQHYEHVLKTEKKFQKSALNKAIQRFRKVIRYAVAEDYLDKDPFTLYKAKRVKKEVLFLSPDQLEKLEETSFIIKRIQQIKDMFVFCFYTGLGFKEKVNLKKQNITTEFDGESCKYIDIRQLEVIRCHYFQKLRRLWRYLMMKLLKQYFQVSTMLILMGI